MKNQLTKLFFLWLLYLSNYYPVISQNLVVQKSDGTENSVSLDVIRKLVFSGNSLQIKNNSGGTTDFQLTDIRKIFFSNSSSSIDQVVNENEKLIVFPNPASIELNIEVNVPLITHIEIYNFQGKKVKTSISNNGIAKIDISELRTGIYLIKAGSQTTKFIKQ